MTIPGMNPAKRRYLIRFISATAIYVVVSLALIHYLVRVHPTGRIVYFLAVLPAIPIIGSIVVIGLYLAEEKDEFQRAVFERSLLWGMGGTLAATSIWGFLETFAHVRLVSSHVSPLFWVFALFMVCTGIARIGLDAYYYRSRNEEPVA